MVFVVLFLCFWLFDERCHSLLKSDDHLVVWGDTTHVTSLFQGRVENQVGGWSPETAPWLEILDPTGIKQRVQCSENGEFALALEPGTYCVRVDQAGWQPYLFPLSINPDAPICEIAIVLRLAT
ncbi:MAG: hypothetical protein H6510_17100 [Acidobacteria bacterium]|nr:hypothetical protein [Acidobacteriota bacterium]MCB9399532.1 hypothetical protein [Acidobacteriota bacterium]